MPSVITAVLCSFARAGVPFASLSELTYEPPCSCFLQPDLAWRWHFYAGLFVIPCLILQSLIAIVIMCMLVAAIPLEELRCCLCQRSIGCC
jgi:hypothetical protein